MNLILLQTAMCKEVSLFCGRLHFGLELRYRFSFTAVPHFRLWRHLVHTSYKFGQLVPSKIIETVAVRCHILRPKCTKFDFGAKGAHSASLDSLAGFKGSYF